MLVFDTALLIVLMVGQSTVSILVLVDVGLRLDENRRKSRTYAVSILVLVDVGLRLVNIRWIICSIVFQSLF